MSASITTHTPLYDLHIKEADGKRIVMENITSDKMVLVASHFRFKNYQISTIQNSTVEMINTEVFSLRKKWVFNEVLSICKLNHFIDQDYAFNLSL